MSLINQALRKAQQERSQGRAPENATSTPAAPTAPAPSGASGMKPGLIFGLVAAFALLIGLVVGLSIVLLKSDSQPVEAMAAPPPQVPSITSVVPTELAQAPLASNEDLPQETERITPPAFSTEPTQADDDSSRIVNELREAREAAEATVAETEPETEAGIEAEVDLGQQIIDWLARARINGVKISDSESRVILNGKSYDAGEYVNRKLGLRIMIIQEKRVLFVDDSGKKYLKRI